MGLVKVAANSRASSVAGAIAGIIRETGRVDVQAIAIAHGYLALDAIEITCIPSFTEVSIDGKERTAMRFAVESHRTIATESTLPE